MGLSNWRGQCIGPSNCNGWPSRPTLGPGWHGHNIAVDCVAFKECVAYESTEQENIEEENTEEQSTEQENIEEESTEEHRRR